MNPRYFIAISVPVKTSIKIKKNYLQNFKLDTSIKDFHISLIPPFFIKDKNTENEIIQKIKEINFEKFDIKTTSFGIFSQKNKQILYLNVKPKLKIKQLAMILNKKINKYINIDFSPYTNNQLPFFDPHITLSYDFKEKSIPKLPTITFLAKKLTLFKQETKTNWTVLI